MGPFPPKGREKKDERRALFPLSLGEEGPIRRLRRMGGEGSRSAALSLRYFQHFALRRRGGRAFGAEGLRRRLDLDDAVWRVAARGSAPERLSSARTCEVADTKVGVSLNS